MMNSPAKDKPIKDFVSVEDGLVSREIFVNPEIYQRELEQIFARTWLFVGHESLIPNPGDFFVSCMGEESVILARDGQRTIHVFLNTCRHRGMRVCRYDDGNTAVFTCPYHGWAYGLDGKLVGVPYFREGYHERLDRDQWGLVEVAQLANYKGTIWATWDPKAPPFAEYLGGMSVYLDLLVDQRDGREGGSEVIAGVQKWRIPCNWKFAAENFVGDSYHAISHRSVDMIGISPDGQDRFGLGLPWWRVAVSFPELGHGTNTRVVGEKPEGVVDDILGSSPARRKETGEGGNPRADIVEAYFSQAYKERQKRLGEKGRLVGAASTIFPNCSFVPWQPRTISVWHPRGPLALEAWRFYLVDMDAPEEVKDVLRHYAMRFSGPGGMTEQDDMENWGYASAASKGTIARRYPYNYQLGLGFERHSEFPPGLVSDLPSEQNQRYFYRRWAELMEAKSWNSLPPRQKDNT
jgi:phenylpropionate dioxygenase-like ring-hydroxylating dioxygenase large terminal subunit